MSFGRQFEIDLCAGSLLSGATGSAPVKREECGNGQVRHLIGTQAKLNCCPTEAGHNLSHLILMQCRDVRQWDVEARAFVSWVCYFFVRDCPKGGYDFGEGWGQWQGISWRVTQEPPNARTFNSWGNNILLLKRRIGLCIIILPLAHSSSWIISFIH